MRAAPLVALILPACHEELTIVPVLDELWAVLGEGAEWLVAVGVNGSTAGADRTAELARRHRVGAVVAETPRRGYGRGCQAAIDRLDALGIVPDAYVFFAADGANDPRDVRTLVEAYRAGFDLVLGSRTGARWRANRAAMGTSHLLANRVLGAWCGGLTGKRFTDLGPLRLIERGLFGRLGLREWTFGWTIEAQVVAARLGAAIVEVPVRERRRLAGEQKVSKVSWRRTLAVGWQIALAGWRAKRGQRAEGRRQKAEGCEEWMRRTDAGCEEGRRMAGGGWRDRQEGMPKGESERDAEGALATSRAAE